MNVTDSIADMLTRIRNANSAGKASVEMPSSKLKVEIANVLKREGYVSDVFVEKNSNGHQVLTIHLKVMGNERSIVGIKRVSRPSLRRYVHSKDIPWVLGGMGISILTTSKGIMTGRQAKKANVGGEILASVW